MPWRQGLVAVLACVVAVSTLHAVGAAFSCPNACNLHGECQTDSTCTCYTGFTGPACEDRVCPTGAAWSQKAVADDSVHDTDVECSNAGLCDTTTGDCKCFSGFTGVACERTLCPNDCSNAGRCIPIDDMATSVGYTTNATRWDDGVGPTYSQWDASRQYGCLCDWGRTGPDCSLRMCPKGDDVRTKRQLRYSIQLDLGNTDSTEALTGNFKIAFAGHVTSALSASCETTTAAVLSAALEELEPIANATVSQGTVDATTKGCRFVIVLDFNRFGQNNVFSFDSEPSVDLFTCINDGVDSAITGLFYCHFVRTDLSLQVSGSSLVGTTFKVQIADTTYEPHSFVFSKDNGNWSAPIRITGEQQQLPGEDLYLRFSNTVGWTKLARWIITATSSSATLTSSPTYREHEYCGGRAMCDFTNGYCDGCTGNSFGETCNYLSFEDIVPETALDKNFRKLNPTLSNYSSDVMRIRIHQWESENFDAIRVACNEKTTFRVSGLGIMHGLSGDMGPYVESGTLTTEAGITVDTQGLNVEAGGATITTGQLLAPDGLTVNSSASTPILDALSSHSTFSGSALKVTSARSASTAFNMLTLRAAEFAVFDLNGDGSLRMTNTLNAQAGVTIDAGGLTLPSGAATVTSGQLYVTTAAAGAPPIHIDSQDAAFANDLIRATSARSSSSAFNLLRLGEGTPADMFTVRGDGLVAIAEGGLNVVQDSATVESGGFVVGADGHTITAGGLQLDAGGATVTAGGIVSPKPVNVTVHNFVSREAFVIQATDPDYTGNVLEAAATNNPTPTTDFKVLRFMTGGLCQLCVRGDGLVRMPGSAILGNSSRTHNITFRTTIQGSNLVFEGPNADANELTMTWPAMTDDREVEWRERGGTDNWIALSTALTGDRIPHISGNLVTTGNDLLYDGSTLSMDGPTSTTLQSSSGTITLTAATSATLRAASGDVTVATQYGNSIALLATHATNGMITLSSNDDTTVTARDGLVSLTTDDTTATGSISLLTGDASSGTVGGITLSVGSPGSDEAPGNMVLSTGSSDDDQGDFTITGGASSHTSATGGVVYIAAGAQGADGLEDGDGGSVSIVAGAGGSAAGGSVELRGTNVRLRDGSSNTVVHTTSAAVDLVAPGTADAAVVSTGLLEVQGSTTMVLTAQDGLDLSADTAAVAIEADTLLSLTTRDGTLASPITISAGSATGTAAHLTLEGGDTSSSGATGGVVSVLAGAGSAAGSTGGSVSILAGVGLTTGGDLVLHGGPTAAGTDGDIILHDGAGNTVATIGDTVVVAATAVDLSATTTLTLSSTGSSATMRANGALDLSSGAAVSVVADSAGMVLTTSDGSAAADLTVTAGSTDRILPGAYVNVAAGPTSSNSATGGHVSITGGQGSGGAGRDGGDVVLQAGSGVTSGAVIMNDGAGTARVSAGSDVTVTGADVLLWRTPTATASGDIVVQSGTATAGTSGDMVLQTGAATGGASGAITFSVGTANTHNSDITIRGGAATAASQSGGGVTITGGSSTHATGTTGGTVSIVGGAGVTTGGSVSIVPGDGTSSDDGYVRLRDGAGTDRVVVTPSGAVSMVSTGAGLVTATTTLTLSGGTTASLEAAGALTLESTGSTLAMQSEGQITLTTEDVSGAAAGGVVVAPGTTNADGGDVTITGGLTTGASQVGGHVVLLGGPALGGDITGTGGDVSIVGGVGTTGGSITLQPASTSGDVVIKGTDSYTAVTIDTAVTLSASNTLTLSSPGAATLLTTAASGANIGLSASSDLTLSSGALLTLSSDTGMVLTTDDSAAAAGPISIVAGASSTTTGGHVVVSGGLTSTAHVAGSTSITAGAGAGGAGDFGGTVFVQPGSGSVSDGVVQLQDADSTTRVSLAASGNVDVTGAAVAVQTDDVAAGTGTLAIASGASSFGDSGDVTVAVGTATTGAAGNLVVAPGNSPGTTGAVSITAGATSDVSEVGGHVDIVAGASTHGTATTGGSVTLNGGSGSAVTGGDVVVGAGDGVTDGAVTLKDGAGTDRITLESAGNLAMDASGAITLTSDTSVGLSTTDSGTMTLTAGGNIDVITTAALSVVGKASATVSVPANAASGAGDITLQVGDTNGAFSAGHVVITAGTSTQDAGGSVSVAAGASASNNGGDIVLRVGDGNTDGTVSFNSVATGTPVATVTAAGAMSIDATSALLSTLDASGTSSGDLSVFTGDSTSGNTGHMLLYTGAGSSTAGAGDISIVGGQAYLTTNPGSFVLVQGGPTTAAANDGGAVSIVGGAATTGVGGGVSIVGGTVAGAAVPTGGNVEVVPGDSATDGEVKLQHAGGTDVVTVQTSGNVLMSPVAGQALVVDSTNDLTLTATTSLTLTSNSGAVVLSSSTTSVSISGTTGTLITTDGGGTAHGVFVTAGASSDDGAAVVVTGGSTAASSSDGGAIVMEGGGTSDADGGHVSIVGGAGGATGGSVFVRGTGTGGEVRLQDTGGTTRLMVEEAGAVSVTPNGSPLLHSSSAMTLSTTGTDVMTVQGTTVALTSASDLIMGYSENTLIEGKSAGSGNVRVDVAAGNTVGSFNGAPVILSGGASNGVDSIGGDCSVTGGAGFNAADVILLGGAGGGTGGDVVVRGGDGTTTDGGVELQNVEERPLVGVRSDGSVLFRGETTLQEETATNKRSMVGYRTHSAGTIISAHMDRNLLVITEDGEVWPNAIHQEPDNPVDGQLYIVLNLDSHDATDMFDVPAGKKRTFIYSATTGSFHHLSNMDTT